MQNRINPSLRHRLLPEPGVALHIPGWREELYGELQPLCRKLIRKYADCRESREDLAGDLYCRFCSLLKEYDPDRGVPLRGYLVRQLIVAAYSHARSRWRLRRRVICMDSAPGFFESIHEPDPTPEWDERIIRNSIMQAVRSEMKRLPERQRQVLIGRYFEQRSYEEIASSMNIETSSVRSLMRYAIHSLRRRTALQRLA